MSIALQIQEAGAREFPGCALDPEEIEELARGRDLDPDMPANRAAELYLAYACALGDEAAIATLGERYLGGVAAALERGRSRDLVAEAIQQLAATVLLPRSGRRAEIADFTGSGPLAGWLRIVALRILLRLERRDRRATPPEEPGGAVPLPEDPELAYLRRRYGAALQRALADAWSEIDPETRVLLRLRYRDDFGIDDIAGMEKVHRATAARRLVRAEERLIGRARDLLRQRLGATDLEINSVLRAIRSKIQLSVSGIVRD